MNLFSKKDVKTMTIAEQFVSKVEQEALSNKIRVYAPMILLVFMTIVFSIYDSHFFSMKNLIVQLHIGDLELVGWLVEVEARLH